MTKALKPTYESPYIVKDERGNETYYENHYGSWHKQEFDERGNRIYFEDSNGFWEKREYDAQGEMIFYEDSDGVIVDKRQK